MSDFKDLEQFGFQPEVPSEKKEDIDDLSEFGFEPEIVEEVEEDAMSPISGTLLGAGIGQAVKSGSSAVSPLVDRMSSGVKQLPIIGEFARAAEYAEKGKGVVGNKQRQKIIKESEELAEDLSDKLSFQKKKASQKIGKVINLVDKKLDPTNLNQSLNQIEKSISSIKAPTEEGQKSLDSIKNLLDDYKKVKSEYSIKSKGKVKTGIEEATDKLETIKSKLIMEAEQLGEEKSFGPTKVIPEAKRVGALDIQKGKFISTPIKTGEFSPIEISKKDTSFFQKMSTDDLKSLERKVREVKQSTAPNTQAFTEAIKAEGKIKEAIEERIKQAMGQQGIDIYKSGAKEYSDVIKAYDLFPELTKGELGNIKSSDFIRKVGDSNMAAYTKKQIIDSLFDKIKDDPEKLKEAKEAIYEISDRYGLSHLSTKYGIDTSMLRNLSVRAGDITGKVVKYPKKIASAIIKKAPWIGAIAGFGLTYSQARAEGRPVGEAIAEAAKEEGIDTLLGPFALMKPDQVGPKQDSIEYKLERGEQLSKEDLQELNERVKNNFKKTVENNPEKVDLNAIADSFDEIKQKPTSVSNQLRGIQKEQDPRRKKAKINFVMQTPGYRSVEKSIDNYMKSIIESFFGEDGQDNKEMQGVQNEEDNTNSTMPDNTPGIESKKKVENTREPSSVVEEVSSTAPGVDLDFLGRREGYSTEGYIPVEGKGKNYTSNSGSGTIAGKSGVTIANGLDLGQRNNLDDIDVSDNIKEKLTPYLEKKKQDALDELRKNPLVLTEDESKELSEAVERSYYNQVKNKFNKNKNGRDFETLPNAVKTALYSLYYNQGSIGPKALEAASNDDNYDDLIKEFRNYYKKGSKADKESAGDRRRIEADYMEKMLKDYKKYKDYNKA